MEDKYSLEGRLVTVFLRGSWDFTGRVEFSSKDKIVLAGDIGSLVVYKENIVAAMIIDEKKIKEGIEPESSLPYDIKGSKGLTRPPSLRVDFDDELNLDQQSFYGTGIPEDMLEGNSEKEIPVSFSISMSQFKSEKLKENSKDGPTEKTPEYRRKTKEGV